MIRLANGSGSFKGFPNATMAPMTFLGRRYLGSVNAGFSYTTFTHTHNLNKRVGFIQGLLKGSLGSNGDHGQIMIYNPPLGAWADIMFSIVDNNSFTWSVDASGNGGLWVFYADLYGDDGTNTWGGTNYTPS